LFVSVVLSFFCSLAFCSLVLSLFSHSRSFFVRSFFLLSHLLYLFVARFKIKSKENNKNVRLIRIKINNIHWCHAFKIYFVWNEKTSLFFAIVYLKKFKLFFRVNSTRIAKSRRDLSVIWSNSRSFDIKARIKRFALRDNRNESMFLKTNFCLFLFRKVQRFFIIRVMINVNKIFSLSKNVCASKDKKAISFKNRSISFFWMTSSFRWNVKLFWIVSTFRQIVNFLATCLFFFFSFAITATTTTSFINFLSYLFNQSFAQSVIIARRFFIVFIKWTFLIIFLIMTLFKNSS
jgi:hypothetical protein